MWMGMGRMGSVSRYVRFKRVSRAFTSSFFSRRSSAPRLTCASLLPRFLANL